MSTEEKLMRSIALLRDYEDMLSKMPENTLMGRLCINSYIRRERRKIDKYMNELDKES